MNNYKRIQKAGSEQNQGIEILYGAHSTPFGKCFMGLTGKGICHFSFLAGQGRPTEASALGELKRTWPKAEFRRDTLATGKAVARLFRQKTSSPEERVPIYTMGTPFQIKVWEAAMKIPPGEVLSYQKVARLTGKPRAARAVGSALARNPVGYLIPCHRVIHESGAVGKYRWGRSRKQAMLAWENAGARKR